MSRRARKSRRVACARVSLFHTAHKQQNAPPATPPPPRRRFDARLCALALLVAASSCLFAATRGPSLPGVAAEAATQAPARPRAPTRGRRAPRPRSVNYSDFSHASAKHLARDCAACHRVESFERPDIDDYPDHPSCVDCHRPQFFRGARPAICTNCHTVAAPRGAARFAFPRPNRLSEFADVFPHSNHVKATSLIQFKRILGDKATTTATCQYCHKVDTRDFRRPPGARPADFAPAPGTFMTTPTSHATCFQCHWRADVDGREQEPLASQCAGCHRNTAVALRATTTNSAGSAPATTTQSAASVSRTVADSKQIIPTAAEGRVPSASTPRETTGRGGAWPARVSPKFAHEIEPHKTRTNDEGKEVPITCLQCHAAARKATSLEIFRLPESRVRLLTCASTACHTAVTGSAQLRLSVFRELRERGRDAKFDCALCHSPPVSTAAEVPCGHYAAVHASAVREKKNTKGIEGLTPERCRDALK